MVWVSIKIISIFINRDTTTRLAVERPRVGGEVPVQWSISSPHLLHGDFRVLGGFVEIMSLFVISQLSILGGLLVAICQKRGKGHLEECLTEVTRPPTTHTQHPTSATQAWGKSSGLSLKRTHGWGKEGNLWGKNPFLPALFVCTSTSTSTPISTSTLHFQWHSCQVDWNCKAYSQWLLFNLLLFGMSSTQASQGKSVR